MWTKRRSDRENDGVAGPKSWRDPSIDKIKVTVREVKDHLTSLKDRYDEIRVLTKNIELPPGALQRVRNGLPAKGSTERRQSIDVPPLNQMSSTSPRRGSKDKARSLGTSRKSDGHAKSKKADSSTGQCGRKKKFSSWANDPRRIAIEGFLHRHEAKQHGGGEDEKLAGILSADTKCVESTRRKECEEQGNESDCKEWWEVDSPGYGLEVNVGHDDVTKEEDPDVGCKKSYDSWANTSRPRKQKGFASRKRIERDDSTMSRMTTSGEIKLTQKGWPPRKNIVNLSLGINLQQVRRTGDTESKVSSQYRVINHRETIDPADVENSVEVDVTRPRTNKSGIFWFHNRDAISRRLEERRMCLSPNNLSLPEMDPRMRLKCACQPLPARILGKPASSSLTPDRVQNIAANRLGVFGAEIENVNSDYRCSFTAV